MQFGRRDSGDVNFGVAFEWEVVLQLRGLKLCSSNEPFIIWQGFCRVMSDKKFLCITDFANDLVLKFLQKRILEERRFWARQLGVRD